MNDEDKTKGASIEDLWEARPGIADLQTKMTEPGIGGKASRNGDEKFRIVAEAARDAIIMVDGEGVISYWNPAAEKIFRYEEREAIGKNLGLIIPKRYHGYYEKGLKAFRESGLGPAIGKTVESEAIGNDGLEFPVELSLSAVLLRGRWHAVGLVRDITNRKRMETLLRENIGKYLIMLQKGRDAIMLIDFETKKVLEVNQATVDLYGYSRDELLRKRAFDFEANTQVPDAAGKELPDHLEENINLSRHKRRDGTIFPVEVSACSFMWKGRRTYCAVVRCLADCGDEQERDGKYITKKSLFG